MRIAELESENRQRTEQPVLRPAHEERPPTAPTPPKQVAQSASPGLSNGKLPSSFS